VSVITLGAWMRLKRDGRTYQVVAWLDGVGWLVGHLGGAQLYPSDLRHPWGLALPGWPGGRVRAVADSELEPATPEEIQAAQLAQLSASPAHGACGAGVPAPAGPA
jgi:hypothetical protein